jgi:hypothetical protein
LLLQQRTALLLRVTDFGEAPDLLRDAGVVVAFRIDASKHCRAIASQPRRDETAATVL